MKKELKKPMRELSQLRVHAYDGEACLNGNNNEKVEIKGSGCQVVNGICISLFEFFKKD